MKKLKIFAFVVFISTFIGIINIKAQEITDYFDSIFANDEYTLYTDAEYTSNDSFDMIVNQSISRFGFSEYWNSSEDYSYLRLSNNGCNLDTMKCNFSLYRDKMENDNYSNEIIKEYTDITIKNDSNIDSYFSMVSDDIIKINYDDSMFSSDIEKYNYIGMYLNTFGESSGNTYVSYSYDSYLNKVFRVESYNSKTVKIMVKNIDDIVFEYTEEPYSEEFKKFTTGTLTIKTDSDINNRVLSDYLNGRYSANFQIDGVITNNKVFIKRVEYIDGQTVEKEKHLITLVKDANIDVSVFDRIGYGNFVNIKADVPSNINDYIQNYIGMTYYSFNSETDGIFEYYDEIFEYDDDYAIIKYVKQKDGNVVDIQFHKVLIKFVGYDNEYSSDFVKKVGNEITVNADHLDLQTINASINGNARALSCNDDFSVCDIAFHNYKDNTTEIHKVNIKLNDTISDEFIDVFKIKDDKTIDIIVDDEIDLSFMYLNYYYYDRSNDNSLGFNCHNGKCTLTLNNYVKNKSEIHEINYNIVKSKPTKSYLSLVKDSVDVYPGETSNVWVYLSSGQFFGKNDDTNTNSLSCDKVTSKCSVAVRNSDKNLEIHNSSVNIKNGKSKEFNKLFPGKKIKINSIYKDDPEYVSIASMAYLMSKTKTWSYLTDYNEGKGKVIFNSIESHTMDVDFVKGNEKHKKIVDNIIEKIGNEKFRIEFDDLEFINNFYYNDSRNPVSANVNSKKLNEMMNKTINNKHISYFFVEQGGLGNDFLALSGGKVVLFYNGVAYGTLKSDLEVLMKNVIYIPDDTPETIDAYVSAAQKRIDEYLGKKSGVVVSFNHKIEDDELDNKYMDTTGYDGNCYNLKYKDKEARFIIIKSSSKMQKSTFNAIDVNNNIVVSSNEANYPLNTIVSSEMLNEEDNQYKSLLERLGLSEAEIIDIDLYSPTVGNIKNFDGVNFDVSVPIDIDNFSSKKLYAYYIDDNGNIEEHPITVDDFIANFQTNHFSTYIIGEKVDSNILNESNPDTLDNIMKWIISAIISIVGLTFICRKFKNKKNM